MSKGSERRPTFVSREEEDKRWLSTFGVTCVRCGGLTDRPGGSCRRPCRECGWPYPDGDCSEAW